MKKVVRANVFESNSSSTHVIQILSKKDYDEFCDGKYLYNGSGWDWRKHVNKPESGKIYSKEEVIQFLKTSDYPPDNDTDWNDDEVVRELFRDNEFYDSDYYSGDRYLESFEETYTTPSGETVVAFGKYGYDC